ncbi:MAG: hypothetical protein HN380_31925, partial [Victivallales bacterium]|nr:hypothetical protein [Victivallales bacterium]
CNLSLVLVNAGFPVPVSWSYGNLDRVPRPPAPDSDALLAAMATGDFAGIASGVYNALEYAVRDKFPLVGMLREAMLAAGCATVAASGSGPTLFGLVEGDPEPMAATVRAEYGDDLWVQVSGQEARTPIWDGNRYYLMNLRSELDAPGEWFLDYRTGRLSYRPRAGESPEQSAIVAPRLTRLVELVAPSDGEKRVEHVTFRGLEFRHTDATRDHPAWRSTEDCAILLGNAWHCVIRDCRFTNIGGYAIRLSLDSCLNRVVGNEIAEAGAGGILLRGPWVGWGQNTLSPEPSASVLSPLGNLIDHNHVHHCGRIKKYVAGIHVETRPKALAYAPGNVYRHNHIHHLPRNGIFGFRNLGGYVVEQNHIHDVLQESDDGGLIHFCTNAINGTAPALIRRNLLHEVTAFRQDDVWLGRTGLAAAANGHGVYLDGYTSYVTVEQNVIRNTRKGCVFIHDGQNNTIRNNILLDDRKRQFWQTKSWNNRWERNVVSWSGETPLLAAFSGIDE